MYRSEKKYKNIGICLGSLKVIPKWTLKLENTWLEQTQISIVQMAIYKRVIFCNF